MKILSSRKIRLGLFLKIHKKDEAVSTIQKRKKTAFLRAIKAVPSADCAKYYLRVTYGKFKNHAGKMETFFNDGKYGSKQDLIHALRLFTEHELLMYLKE